MSDDVPPAAASIPGYEIERELGRGGFAVVYRANQPKLRRTVALKVLTNVDPSDEDAKRRFEAECQAIGSLSWHPHVVTVYDAGSTAEGLPFLAMEHLPAGSLQAKLGDHGRAPWEEVLRVAVQMSDALGAAHQAGILHRDIKPANVLTSRIGDYKLADFGIARFGDSQRTATGVITGTVAYTAPEVLRGAHASAASDIYALGAMLCAVASGRTPFVRDADESVVAIMYRVSTDDPPPLDEHQVPPDVALLIHTLMDKDPEKRPATALEVARWAQYLQEQRGLAASPLHTDPDLVPGLPAAALAAGAAALAAGTPAPPSLGTTGAAEAPTAVTPAPSPTSPIPPGDGYGAPAAGLGASPVPGSYDAGAYGHSGANVPATGSYGYQGTGGDRRSNGGKVVAIVAVVALVVVALIIGVVAFTSGDGGSSTASPPESQPTVTAPPESSDPPETPVQSDPPETPRTYPQAVRDSFLDACTVEGTRSYCQCVLEGLEETYSLEEFVSLDGDFEHIDELPPEVARIVDGCQ